MPRKTQGVYNLVNEVLKTIRVPHSKDINEVLNTIRVPYNEDIIEDVCIAIENHSNWRKEYDDLVLELSPDVVKNWIGKYTRQITGLKVVRQVKATRTTIIGSYTKLRA